MRLPAAFNIWSNLRIWQKTLIPLVLCALVATGLAARLLTVLDSSHKQYDALVEREAAAVWATRMGATLLDMTSVTWRALADSARDPAAARKDIEALAPVFAERAARTAALLAGSPLVERIANQQRAFTHLQEVALDSLAIAQADNPVSAVEHLRVNFSGRMNGLRRDLMAFADAIVQDSEVESKQLKTKAEAVHSQSIAMIAGAVLAVSLLGIWIAFAGIITPLRRLTASMDRLAAGQLDTAVPGTTRRDEVGTMAVTVESFRQSLRQVEQLKADQEAAKLQAEADKRAAMNALADRFQASVGHVVESLSSASTELTSAAGSMAAIADETSRQATTVASASEQATTNVQTVASAAEELSSSVAEISRQVSQSTQIAGQAMTEIDQTNKSVQGLTASVARISEVVRLISEIASQTNLLALNATIEAARAGDAGKGFAVVASEVKHLATQTARATEDISGRIGEIQSATGQSVAAIERINAVIQQINEISMAIASAVEEQGAATQEIARNVAQAADGTQLVSSNILQVTQASAETGTAAGQVQSTSAAVAQQAEGLRGEVASFLQQVRAA
jgi:methyl-accepting chemotaxis protein